MNLNNKELNNNKESNNSQTVNCMKQVTEMLGLRWNDNAQLSEDFKIEFSNNSSGNSDKEVIAFLSTSGLHIVSEDIYPLYEAYTLIRILSGEIKVKKLPWKPKDGEYVYLAHVLPTYIRLVIWKESKFKLYYELGLVAKTEKEAERIVEEKVK